MLPGVSGLEICRPYACAPGDTRPPGHHADGARRRERARSWTVDRRRRLHRQAVLCARTHRTGARAAATRQPGSRRLAAFGGQPRAGPSKLARPSRQAHDPPRPDRVPPARISDGEAGPRVLARAAPGQRLGGSRSISTSEPSTFMSGGCARRCRRMGSKIRSGPSAAPGTPSTRPSGIDTKQRTPALEDFQKPPGELSRTRRGQSYGHRRRA